MTELKRVPTRFSVLFLAKWYPNKHDEQLGVFIQKHAKAVAKNCDVAVVFISSSIEPETKISTNENVHEILVYFKKSAFKLINYFSYILATRKAIKIASQKIGKPDIIHAHVLTRTYAIALLLNKLKGIPFVVSEHWTGYMNDKFNQLSWIKKQLVRFIVKRANYVTVVSETLKYAMLKCGINANYVIIPNVVDNLHAIEKKNVSEKIKFLTVADLVDSQKNVSATIDVCENLVNKKIAFEFHIIGGGQDEEKLRKYADEKILLDHAIFFHGRKANSYVLEKLHEVDFLVVNSNVESFCVIAAEALAAGKPVIATKCGGPELFINDSCGILIPKNDKTSLETAIEKMIHSHTKYNPATLKQIVETKFSAESIGSQFQAIYDKTCTQFVVGLSGKKVFIDPNWLVLDVGSGHRPNKRADVLIDSEMGETIHRSGKVAVSPKGKQMIVADALNMPFLDKQFDYVIASHIAEHVDDPIKLCSEISRVGKQGYLECPGPVDEFFLNEPFHKWIVKKAGKKLVFKQKRHFKPFSNLIYSIYYLNCDRFGHKTMKSNNLLLKVCSKLIIKLWKILPYTYTKLRWIDNIDCLKHQK